MKEPKAWITVKGRRVPIYDGESKADAVKRVKDKDERIKKEMDKTWKTGHEIMMDENPEYKKKYNQSVQKEIDNAEMNLKNLKASLKIQNEEFEGRHAAEIEERIKVWQKRLKDAKAKLR